MLIVTDELDENLFLAARNMPNVIEVVDAASVDPVSLVRSDTCVMTRGRGEEDRGVAGMSHETSLESTRLCGAARAAHLREERAPCRDSNQVRFRGGAGRDQARGQGRGRAAVQGQGRSRCTWSNVKGKEKRFAFHAGRQAQLEERRT